jgi:threonine dehydratase
MDLIKQIVAEVNLATDRLEGKVLKTPLILSRPLSKIINGKVFLKLENEQYIGSFKARGALNKLLSLSDHERSKELVTASTGNHAQGFARAVEMTNTNGIIYMPENASPTKIEALSNYPVELFFHGQDSLAAELHGKKMALADGKLWISPYNDVQVIGGQGSMAVEILDQLIEAPDYVLVTIGGGGMISGIGSYMKTTSDKTKVIGCLPTNSPEMALSLEKGEIVVLPEPTPTLSDGSAGGLEPGSITFPICQQVVDECILTDEQEIAEGIRYMAKHHKKIVEGSAGVAIAALQNNPMRFKNSTVVIVICGANIDLNIFKQII